MTGAIQEHCMLLKAHSAHALAQQIDEAKQSKNIYATQVFQDIEPPRHEWVAFCYYREAKE